MEKIDTNDKLEKVRLNFSRCANRDVAPLIKETTYLVALILIGRDVTLRKYLFVRF